MVKKKLKERYGNDIIISAKRKKKTIVSFTNIASNTLIDTWYTNRANNDEDERLRIVRAAAEIIREDIKSKTYEFKTYPSGSEFYRDVKSDIPKTLTVLLENIIKKDKKNTGNKMHTKCLSIGHSIIAATRSRSFKSHIQLGISVYIHRKLSGKTLIDMLSNISFCASYKDTVLYEASILASNPVEFPNEAFTQFVFDNADFNVNTIDGNNTFHCMGGIQCITPRCIMPPSNRIFKLQEMPLSTKITVSNNIPIKVFHKIGNSFKNMKVLDVDLNAYPGNNRIISEFMWVVGKWIEKSNLLGWHGYMERMLKSVSYDTSKIIFLPFVNLIN